jgi:two-component system chemotaxis sensor kinase CheA
MNALLEQFLQESREAIEGIGSMLMQLEADPDDAELMTGLFRLVHTLKGNSGLFDFPEMTRVLHAGEDLMDAVRQGQVPYSRALADGLLDAMDFVGLLCDDAESGTTPDARLARRAVTLAKDLRALKVATSADTDDGLEAPDASPAREPQACLPTLNLDAAQLARLPLEAQQAAWQQAQAGATLLWLHYTPDAGCFFQGEDPLHQARHTPGLIWGGIAARAAWPPLAELDAYQCALDFDVLSAASIDEVQAHYRYVPEQVQLWQLGAQCFADIGPASAHATAHTNGRMDDQAHLARTAPTAALSADDVALQQVLAVQRMVLSLPSSVAWEAGRIGAVVTCLSGCLQSAGRAAQEATYVAACGATDLTDATALRAGLQASLQAAATQALQAQSSAPLLAWMDEAFATPPAPPAIDAPQPEPTLATPQATDAGTLPGATSPTIAGNAEAADPIDPDDAPEAEARATRRGDEPTTVKSLKVDQAKVDRLMNLIGEMVVAKNAMPYLAIRAETVYGARELSREIKAQHAVINRISEEMQDAIMQVRMMPVSFVFQRFPRLVRDTSRRLGKDVNLVLEGQETAADKNIIEALGDPLVHIVRNSLDHGLETPEARERAGKPPTGTLRITARQEADRVLIEISDDGKGIDPDIVKRKAYQNGLIDEATLERITDQEAVNLVFAPGFSTAEVVSDLSGRGVGMDAVRTAVERVNGRITLDSVKGQGTCIRLWLPLSMSVTKIMTLESDGQPFGVPMDVVLETVRLPRASVRHLKQRMCAVLRGQVIRLKTLNSILGLAAAPLANDNDELAVLVVRIGTETLGLVVDDFHETSNIVLKPLAGVLGQLPAYAGSALMGDGSVLMVLNVKEMV